MEDVGAMVTERWMPTEGETVWSIPPKDSIDYGTGPLCWDVVYVDASPDVLWIGAERRGGQAREFAGYNVFRSREAALDEMITEIRETLKRLEELRDAK